MILLEVLKMCGKKLKSCKKTDKVKSIMLFSWAKAARDFKRSISDGASKEDLYREAYWRGVQDALSLSESKSCE